MRKFLTTALAVALTWAAASAVPAKPGQNRTVMQSDGTSITLHMVGDEWHHSWVTTDGKPVIEAANGDMVYRTADGASTVIAHEKNARTLSEQSFLNINASQMTAKAIMAKSPRARAGRENAARNMAKPAFRSSYSAVRNGADGPRKGAGNPQVATVGSPRVPVILVQYTDKSFSNTKAQIQEAYTSLSTSKFSALRYFKDQSNGMFTPQFEFYGPYTLDSTRATYGGNKTSQSGSDQGVAKMVGEAIDKAGNDITWTNYDNDNDGEADVVIVIYAGVGEAQASSTVPDAVWPCQWTLSSGKYYSDGTGTRTRNGVKIDAFGVFNEINGDSDSGTSLDGVGTYCHEFGHVMGLPDFYETTYENDYYGMGYWDIMCSGSYNNNGYCPVGYNAYEKEFMGWHTPSTPVENHQYTLPKWNAGDDVSYKVTSPLNSNECYYLENRVKQGWDKYIDDEGMLVTHLTYVASRWSDNSPNDEAVQLFTIIPADNKLSINNETADCFGETNHALTDDSTPAAKLNMYADGSRASTTGGAGYMQQPLTEININSSDKSVTFWYMKGSTTPLDAPVLADASNVTTDGWTASWGAVTGAATYELQIDPASGGGGSTSGTVYTKVTDASTLSDGDKVIIVSTSQNVAMGAISGSYFSEAAVTVSNNQIDLSANTTGVNVFTLEGSSGAWKFKDSDGKYLKSTTAKSMSLDATGSTTTISISDGDATITFGSAGRILHNVTNTRFTTYTSNTSNSMLLPQLYKLGGSSSAPRRAGATSRTITEITGTSYTVTGMADDTNYTFKVRAVPATTDTEHSTGDWSNVKTVKTNVGTHEPAIVANETMDFGSIYVDATKTADLEIAYDGLTAPITATISGAGADMFSCDESIAVVSAGNNETTLTVTYSPTAAGTHTATLTLNSTGADPVTCTLTGTATLAPLTTYNPVMQDATGVTTSAFTATWTDQTDAEAVASYTLQISKKPETTTTTIDDVLNNGNTINSTSQNYSNWTASGNTLAAAYSGNSGGSNTTIQLRSNNNNSGIVSTTSGGKIKTVTVDWYSGTSDGRVLNVYGSNSAYTAASDLYDNDKQGTLLGTIVKGTSTELTISGEYAYIGVRSNSGAMYLNSITFSWEQTTTAGSAPRRAVNDTGNADSDVRTITGITSKSYEVTGLTAGATYEYKVKAIYTDRAEADESAWSDVKEVTLNDVPHTPTLAADDLEFDGDYYVGGTYTKTLTVLGKYLSGDVTVSIAGDDAEMFSVASQTIAASAFTNGEYALTVTYSPTTAGVHSATLTLSSEGAEDVTVNLTGIADWQLFAPQLLAAQSVTSSSFKAVWTDETNVSKVKSYTLWVNKTADGGSGGNTDNYKLLLEQTTMGSTTWTKGGSTTAENGYLRLGSSKSTGSVTSPSFDLSDYNGKVTVVVVAKQYSEDSNVQMKITVGSATQTFTGITTETTYVAVLDATAGNNTVKIENLANSQRPMLKSVKVYGGDASSLYPTASTSAPRRAVATSGDADNGGLTVTGITDKSYTVTGLTPLATYEFKVKAVYADDSESEWTEVKSVTLEDTDEPRLSVSPTALTFDAMYVGATAATKTFTVTAANLTEDVTVAVSGDSYSVSPATLTADDANGATVTVTYNPSAAGSHTGTVTLSSNEFDAVTVSLSGSASYQHVAPMMQANTTKGATSFLAEWTDETASAAVTSYTLFVNRKPDAPAYTLLLSDTFSKTSSPTNDSNSDVSSSLNEYTDVAGWTGTKVYQAASAGLKLGSSSVAGELETPALDLSTSCGKVTVKFNAKQFGSKTTEDNKVSVQCGTTSVNQTLTTTATDYIVVLDCSEAANQTITFTGSKRLYIYNVQVYSGDASSALSGAPRRVATDGDADDGGLTVTGITEKSYTVTGLTPGATYEYYVKANYSDDTVSDASNHEEVTLPDGTTLADVLESESGSYTVSDDMVIVAAIPASHMYYATNGTDWLPIESETTLTVGQKIHNVGGTFNGSSIAPLLELTTSDTSDATIDYNIATYYLGNDFNNVPQTWEEMPVAGQVIDIIGYLFNSNGTPTLHAYSGGNAGRSMALKTDFVGLNSYDDGQYMKLRVCVELKQAWSGARRRIGVADSDAYTNLMGQVIEVSDVYTGISDIDAGSDPVKRQYVNAAGAVSDTPYDGFNIVVTTWSDGTTTAVKVAH